MSIFHRTHHGEPKSGEHADTGHHADTSPHTDPGHHSEARVVADEAAHDRFGGVNWGSAFFGWLVAIGMTLLLAGIIGAIASAVGENTGFTLDDAEREAGAVGLFGAIAAAVVLALAYFTGGYVAGRMSRFDGARQGAAVWVIGLLITIVAGALGWLFGSEYDVLERFDVPNIDMQLSGDSAAIGGIITVIVVLFLTLAAAMAGGKFGQRYHHKVDSARYL